ncbi:hypothetical protein BS17DRAFT_518243 [Gyrodon lividus]|nr:hypothetical protein BS17DRAFT_518243 [Gyrodon lividus]
MVLKSCSSSHSLTFLHVCLGSLSRQATPELTRHVRHPGRAVVPLPIPVMAGHLSLMGAWVMRGTETGTPKARGRQWTQEDVMGCWKFQQPLLRPQICFFCRLYFCKITISSGDTTIAGVILVQVEAGAGAPLLTSSEVEIGRLLIDDETLMGAGGGWRKCNITDSNVRLAKGNGETGQQPGRVCFARTIGDGWTS